MKKFSVLPLLPCFALAQAPTASKDVEARRWSNTTTLSYVSTSGNSIVDTIGFSNDFVKKWSQISLTVKGGMLRSDATLSTPIAYGTSLEDAIIEKIGKSTLTAENYYLNGRLDYRLKDRDRWYWYGGSSWERNVPVGLNSRLAVTGGIGHIFADTDKNKWRMDAGLGVTREIPTVIPQGFQKEFGTINLTSELKHSFNKSVSYNADAAYTYNLKESRDWIVVLKQGLKVAMTKGIALKVGLDANYRNKPIMIPVKVHSLTDPSELLGNLVFPGKKLDTVATTSLVIAY
jgi:hypothetical protein